MLMWFKGFWDKIDNYFSSNENKKIKELQEAIDKIKLYTNPKEEELNNKYPKKNIVYRRIETDGLYSIDIRNFFQTNDHQIPIIKGASDDDIAHKCLIWVISNIKYMADTTEYKASEYWAYPYQTLKHEKGDCEDGAILLANMMIRSGVPYWKIRLTAGDVKGGGHAYVTYYCEAKDKWVILDWCYWPNSKKIADRLDYKNEANYLGVWFSWNYFYCYTKGLNTEAKGMLKL